MGDSTVVMGQGAGSVQGGKEASFLSKVHPAVKLLVWSGLAAAAIVVIGVLIWQAVAASGNPDPTAEGISPMAMIVDTGVIVFREGLEAILILAALTASLVRTEQGFWKPVALGAGLSFLASIATWFVVVAVISSINAPALHVQAATGLLAIIVLLVIMNWFFHDVYWAGWIKMHDRRKRSLIGGADGRAASAVFRGLVLLGFTAVYREGFEIVLFLQSIRLRCGSSVVLTGVSIGLGLTLLVAVLTFAMHRKLPYKKMLVLTGVMLGIVLLVMVGEQVQEMQQAGWLSTTEVGLPIPDWMGMWFALFPNIEGLAAQALAAALVVGSFFFARRACMTKGRALATEAKSAACMVPDCANCDASPARSDHRRQ